MGKAAADAYGPSKAATAMEMAAAAMETTTMVSAALVVKMDPCPCWHVGFTGFVGITPRGGSLATKVAAGNLRAVYRKLRKQWHMPARRKR